MSASKLNRHLLSGTLKNVLHARGCGLEIRPGLTNSMNQGWRLNCELFVSLMVQKYLSDLIRFVKVDFFCALEEYWSVCDAVY